MSAVPRPTGRARRRRPGRDGPRPPPRWAGWLRVAQRDGVEVPGDHHAVGAAEARAGHHGVAVAQHLEVVVAAQRLLDRVGDRALVAAHRLDVAQVAGEPDDVSGQVEGHVRRGSRGHHATLRGHGGAGTAHYPGAMPDSRSASRCCLGPRPGDRDARRHRPGHLVPVPRAGCRRPPTPRAPAELEALAGDDAARGVRTEVRLVQVDLDAPPADASDAYLRLHLLSHRLVQPNAINLDGIFGALRNVVWTSAGPAPSRASSRPGCGCARSARCRCTASTSSRGWSTTCCRPACGSPTPTACAWAPTWPRAPP